MNSALRRWVGLGILLSVIAGLWAAAASADGTADRMAWWREARFGLFIHWGPVSLKGTEIGWSRGGERRGTGGAPGPIPVEVYDNLYKEFNPVGFDAREWVAMAKNAGMKYLVFTTRHHDGFSMFDSALTDYKITNTPFKRDVVAELAQACHDAGIRLGFYYSPPDWHHPDYRTERHAKFIEFLHGQIRELCTKYGKVDILWFDGLGGTAKDWDSERLIKMIRELQPGIIINNRAGLEEDFETPEQQIGHFQKDRPWETCMTLGDQWAFKPNDRIKSFDESIGVLVRCAGGDGNLLLNVGPEPTGRIEPRQASRLAEIGAWMQRYGETVQGTRGGPFMPCAWGTSTCRGNTVYVHVLDWKGAGVKLTLPGIKPKIVSSSLLTGGDVKVKQTRKGIDIVVPTGARTAPDTIIALQLDASAEKVPPVSLGPTSVVQGKSAKASNVHQKDPAYGADKAIDGNDGTRWATDAGTHKAWLEVHAKKPIRVGAVVIKEACGERVQDFALEYQRGKEWVPFLQGKTIGQEFRKTFNPVKAQVFRLNIRNATEGPTIFEFQLLPAGKRF